MESLLVSTGVVALAEIGDKTQLLAFLLAARFKKPVPIILGILAATIVNHGLAGAFGAWITASVSPEILRWVLGLSFIGMAVWTMIPDEIEEEETKMAEKFGFYDHCLFHTTVGKTEWDEDAGRWIVYTDRGDAIGRAEPPDICCRTRRAYLR